MLLSMRRLYVATAFALTPFLGVPWAARAADDVPPQQTQTQPEPPRGTAHQGVMAPPSTGDSAITKGTPPGEHFPTPVIRPSPTSKPHAATPQKE